MGGVMEEGEGVRKDKRKYEGGWEDTAGGQGRY